MCGRCSRAPAWRARHDALTLTPAPPLDPCALLRELARAPRPAGGPEEARARALCQRLLEERGFRVHEEPFDYSALPGRYGTPAVGIVLGAGMLLAAVSGARGDRALAALILAASAIVVVLGGNWLLARGSMQLEWGRSRSVNLVATRGEPRVWLVAHLDSKSQPIPMLARIAGIVGGALAWLAMLMMALALPAVGRTAWLVAGAVAVVVTLPVILATVRADSNGALDNASGVATVMASVARLAPDRAVGVLLTSAEELGLAGARAWASENLKLGTVLNCDSVDDAGTVVAMYSGRRPKALVQAIAKASAVTNVAVSTRRLLPGVLTDAVAMRGSCDATVTFSRGTAATLARIHSRRDSLETMTGSGMDDVALVLAYLVENLD